MSEVKKFVNKPKITRREALKRLARLTFLGLGISKLSLPTTPVMAGPLEQEPSNASQQTVDWQRPPNETHLNGFFLSLNPDMFGVPEATAKIGGTLYILRSTAAQLDKPYQETIPENPAQKLVVEVYPGQNFGAVRLILYADPSNNEYLLEPQTVCAANANDRQVLTYAQVSKVYGYRQAQAVVISYSPNLMAEYAVQAHSAQSPYNSLSWRLDLDEQRQETNDAKNIQGTWVEIQRKLFDDILLKVDWEDNLQEPVGFGFTNGALQEWWLNIKNWKIQEAQEEIHALRTNNQPTEGTDPNQGDSIKQSLGIWQRSLTPGKSKKEAIWQMISHEVTLEKLKIIINPRNPEELMLCVQSRSVLYRVAILDFSNQRPQLRLDSEAGKVCESAQSAL